MRHFGSTSPSDEYDGADSVHRRNTRGVRGLQWRDKEDAAWSSRRRSATSSLDSSEPASRSPKPPDRSASTARRECAGVTDGPSPLLAALCTIIRAWSPSPNLTSHRAASPSTSASGSPTSRPTERGCVRSPATSVVIPRPSLVNCGAMRTPTTDAADPSPRSVWPRCAERARDEAGSQMMRCYAVVGMAV